MRHTLKLSTLSIWPPAHLLYHHLSPFCRSHPRRILCALPHRPTGHGRRQTILRNWQKWFAGQHCGRTTTTADALSTATDRRKRKFICRLCANGERCEGWRWRRRWSWSWDWWTQRFRWVQHTGCAGGRRPAGDKILCRQQSQYGVANDAHCAIARLVYRRRFISGEWHGVIDMFLAKPRSQARRATSTSK